MFSCSFLLFLCMQWQVISGGIACLVSREGGSQARRLPTLPLNGLNLKRKKHIGNYVHIRNELFLESRRYYHFSGNSTMVTVTVLMRSLCTHIHILSRVSKQQFDYYAQSNFPLEMILDVLNRTLNGKVEVWRLAMCLPANTYSTVD